VLTESAIFGDIDRGLHVLRSNDLELLYFDARVVKQNLLRILEPRARERDLVFVAALHAGRVNVRKLR